MEGNKILETLQNGDSKMHTPTNLTAAPFQVYEIAKVRCRDLLVKIFSGSSDSNPRQFFFEPLVLLDPKSIVSRSHGFFNQNFIRFTLQMWNEELRSKVLERLRSLESLGVVKIGEEDVCVMPFKEVQLVCRPNGISQSIRLVDQPTSYLRSNENLDFYLFCDVLPSSVDVLAKDFRQNTEFTLNGWQLKLECRGLSIKSGTSPAGSALSEYPTFSFNITVNPNESIATSHQILTNNHSTVFPASFSACYPSGAMSMVGNTNRSNGAISYTEFADRSAFASSSRASTDDLEAVKLSSAAKRCKSDHQNQGESTLARPIPDGAGHFGTNAPQIPARPSFIALGSNRTMNVVMPGQVAGSGRGITGFVGPGQRYTSPVLCHLLQTLRKPSTPQQQQEVVQILRSNPQLMAAFVKRRAYLLQQQQQQKPSELP